MKFSTCAGFIFVIMFFGCEIEETIDKAANRCEDKISKVLESVEDVCLTKEEILELVRSIKDEPRVHNDVGETMCGDD